MKKKENIRMKILACSVTAAAGKKIRFFLFEWNHFSCTLHSFLIYFFRILLDSVNGFEKNNNNNKQTKKTRIQKNFKKKNPTNKNRDRKAIKIDTEMGEKQCYKPK